MQTMSDPCQIILMSFFEYPGKFCSLVFPPPPLVPSIKPAFSVISVLPGKITLGSVCID